MRLAGLLLLLATAVLHAQTTVPVLLLSDIHFDPFHDPAKLPQLRAAPIDRWPAILSAPATPTAAADLAALQTACNARALDTPWPLLQTTLTAARDAEPRPLFLALPGDLLTHDFPCRFSHLAPTATPEDQSRFAAQTVSFVLAQLRAAFPRAPLYATLGNNDSPCADYRQTPASPFLQTAATALASAAGIPAASLSPLGDYTVTLPAPLLRTRLIVLNNDFSSRLYTTCAGAPDRTPERQQFDWLRAQLTDAQAHNEHVWLMAHLPPGLDVYNSFRRYLFQPAKLCQATPTAFLADTSLADTLLDFAPTVTLALFGHTHMDEFRLLHREGTKAPDSPAATIPAKLVPSVSPYIGNHPAFLVAAVDPRTAVLKDWRAFVSSTAEGSTPPWNVAYRFTSAFGLPDLSAASAQKLADAFTADKTGRSPQSTAFREHFFPGDLGLYALGLAQIWPAYACTIRFDHPSEAHKCLCDALQP